MSGVQSETSVKSGLIEGFFGRPWSFEDRAMYATFLAEAGYDFYIYAPKKDPHLRREWQKPWPAATRRQMDALRHRYAETGVRFGLGLSPFELYREPWSVARDALRRKLEELKPFEPEILGLFFDDMRGDLPDLAQKQVDMAHLCAEYLSEAQILLCPTYYSFDPILDQVFGQRPDRYLETLGQRLDTTLNMFWTGPEVCSTHYPEEHLQQVETLLQRKPFLWDNYPVNDGKKISRFLHLRPFQHDTALLSRYLSGHGANPMNQPGLSQIPLWTLPQNYREGYNPEQALQESLERFCHPRVATALADDLEALQDQGLDEMGTEHKQRLQKKYAQLAQDYHSVQAQEVADFLDEQYAFDPACLTD